MAVQKLNGDNFTQEEDPRVSSVLLRMLLYKEYPNEAQYCYDFGPVWYAIVLTMVYWITSCYLEDEEQWLCCLFFAFIFFRNKMIKVCSICIHFDSTIGT